MISCAQREAERRITLDYFEELGIRPTVTISPCDPAGPSLNRHAAWHAIRPHAGSGVLFLEDDIAPRGELLAFLEAAERLGKVTTFCLLRDSLLPFTPPPEGRVTARLVRLVGDRVSARRGFYGTQAVYLPPHATEAVTAAQGDFVEADGGPQVDGGDGFDFWLKQHAVELGGIYAAFPSPVQHRYAPKMRRVTRGQPPQSPGSHEAASFYLHPVLPVAY
jgi:hypothetical protein